MEDRYMDFIIKTILTIIVFILIALFALLCQLSTQSRYDVNGDGVVSASDYVEVKNYIMEEK